MFFRGNPLLVGFKRNQKETKHHKLADSDVVYPELLTKNKLGEETPDKICRCQTPCVGHSTSPRVFVGTLVTASPQKQLQPINKIVSHILLPVAPYAGISHRFCFIGPDRNYAGFSKATWTNWGSSLVFVLIHVRKFSHIPAK